MCSAIAHFSHHVRGSFVFYTELKLNFLHWVPAWLLNTSSSEGPSSCKPAGGGYDISDNGNASASYLANNVLSGTGVTHAAVLFSVYLC